MHDLQSRQSSEQSLHPLRIGLADGADQARHLFVSREVKSERPSILVMRAAPACGNAGYVRAGKIARPAAGVIVLFAAMPTGANVYIHAVQYQRLVNPVSGAVALGTLRRTLPVVVWVLAGGRELRTDRNSAAGFTLLGMINRRRAI
ncbi:hypothetical protein [Bradyrhizobium yuanmingense]|uniref:hypothetical protein n=1 Tax=Bradyrhizobium yuanmingense TaxID=108015 RepID=UPI0023B8EF4E|nr:hypothetical protein [Bradyrhizobium yuanmingense]MDF0578541.1 hypothetical protein [Bradyrhizobium yuanmingense]